MYRRESIMFSLCKQKKKNSKLFQIFPGLNMKTYVSLSVASVPLVVMSLVCV